MKIDIPLIGRTDVLILGGTAGACRLAQQLGITLIGFARDETCNIYSHPERIL